MDIVMSTQIECYAYIHLELEFSCRKEWLKVELENL